MAKAEKGRRVAALKASIKAASAALRYVVDRPSCRESTARERAADAALLLEKALKDHALAASEAARKVERKAAKRGGA